MYRDFNLRMQILWLFRLPMAIGLALARCAVSVFFIRTFFTKMYPWLRRTGNRLHGIFRIFLELLIDFVGSISLYLPFDRYMPRHGPWYLTPLPPRRAQFFSALRGSAALLCTQTVCRYSSSI